MPTIHPCLRCGACCAHFRVSFHWREADDATPEGVPVALTTDRSTLLRDMAGTTATPPRCAALSGRVGHEVACSIYTHRPSPCRNLAPSFENGDPTRPSEQCDRARTVHGLVPLTLADWA